MIDIEDKIDKLREHIEDIKDDPNMTDMRSMLEFELLELLLNRGY